jgi:hypothetical protein
MQDVPRGRDVIDMEVDPTSTGVRYRLARPIWTWWDRVTTPIFTILPSVLAVSIGAAAVAVLTLWFLSLLHIR